MYDKNMAAYYDIHKTVKEMNTGLLKKLLEAGVYDVDKKDMQDQTCLDLAVQYSNSSTIELLLQYGSKQYFEIELSKESKTIIEKDGGKFLFQAVQLKNSNLIRALVHWGADINCSDWNGRTLLHYSINELSLITLLLDLGIDVRAGKYTPRRGICCKGTNTAKSLLRCDVMQNKDPVISLIVYGLSIGCDIKIVELLLRYCQNFNYETIRILLRQLLSRYSDGDTIRLINLMAERGASFDTKCPQCKSLLLQVAELPKDCFKIICEFLKLGVSIDPNKTYFWTPIEYAFCKSTSKLFKLLLFCCTNDYLIKWSSKFKISKKKLVEGLLTRNTLKTDKLTKYSLDFIIHGTEKKIFPRHRWLLDHYVKRLAAGLELDLKLQEFLWDEVEFGSCIEDCEIELNNMKRNFICDEVSYFDVLRASKQELITLVKKPKVREAFVLMNTAHFPIYAGILDKILHTGIVFESLYGSMIDDLGQIFRNFDNQLPVEVLDMIIVDYLSLQDLMNLKRAMEKQCDKKTSRCSYEQEIIGKLFCFTLN